MKRYDTYTESGISWIGKVPSHWEMRKLKYLFSERSEKGFPNEPILCSTQKYGVIPQSMYENRVVAVNKGLEGLKLVRKGDFVISLRSFQGGIEYAHYQGIISAAYTILQLNEGASSAYLRYLLKSQPFIQLLQVCVIGIREGQNINYSLLRKNFIPVPPQEEQEEIVAYLDEKCAQIDRYVASLEERIERLGELRQALIAEAVTRGINPQAPLRPSGIPWLGEIPKHWEVKRLGSCFTENTESNADQLFNEAYKFNYGTLVRKLEDTSSQEVIDTYSKYTVLKEGDIVINGLNLNYDFVSQRVAQASQPGLITSAYLVLTPRQHVNQAYYCFLFKAIDSQKLFHGMGTGIRLTLSYKYLKPQNLPVPPQAEQEAIVAYLDEKTTQIDRYTGQLEEMIRQMRDLRQTIISEAVTGKICVLPN